MGIIKDTLYRISNKKMISLFKGQSIFPYYHIVRDDQVAHIEHLYPFKNSAQFKNDLEVLLKNYKPLHPEDLISKKKLHNNFLITFDDGLAEIYTVIYPILKEKKIPAVFFINPEFVDNNEGLYKHFISIIISHLKQSNFKSENLQEISAIFDFSYSNNTEFTAQLKSIRFSDKEKVNDVLKLLDIDREKYLKAHQLYITKAQIQEMIDDGFYFGGHTMTHPPLNQLSTVQQKKEIIDSVDWLKDNFKIPYSMFAFPFTDKNISKKLLQDLFDYDPEILIFGNSGLKQDIDDRIIQRFSFENPNKNLEKHIVTENLYKYFNILTGQYNIKRK